MLMKRRVIEIPEISNFAFVLNSSEILSSTSTRDLLKNIVRCRSSNIWGYGINVKDKKDRVGNMIIQFKNKYGGPDDVYMYYDVPIEVYRRMITAPSKGHYMWYNIRNKYRYSKLTGNKRGVLPNAVN